MKVLAVFCLIWILYINVEVLGQRHKNSRDSRNNGPGDGRNQAPENVGQVTEHSRRNLNHKNHRDNGEGRNHGGRHPERHTENRRGMREEGGKAEQDRRRGGRGRHSKHGHTTTPEPVLTENDMFQYLCKNCKQKDPNNVNCQSLCQASTNVNINKAISGQLGSSFCSFCEYYRSYRSYYQLCRNRLCAAGKK